MDYFPYLSNDHEEDELSNEYFEQDRNIRSRRRRFTTCMYNTMWYSNDNATEYLVRFCNSHKVNDAFNGSLITRGVQEHGVNILFPLYTTVFGLLQENYKK